MDSMSDGQFKQLLRDHKVRFVWKHWGQKAFCSDHAGVGVGSDHKTALANMVKSCGVQTQGE